MKKQLGVGALLLASLALSACAPARMTDNEFLGQVHQHTTTMSNVPDSTILNYVDSACKALRAGTTRDKITSIILSGNYSSAVSLDMAYVLGAGVPVYCPDQKDKL